MRFDNDNSFNQGTDDNPGRSGAPSASGSGWIYLQKLVATCQTDVTLESGTSFYYKDLQAQEAVQSIALVCGNNKVPVDHATITMRNFYTDSKQIFMERHPDKFPGGTFDGGLPNFTVKSDWAQGTPWNDPKTRSKDDTTHRKLLVF